MKRLLKTYKLYDGPNKVSPYSKYYGTITKNIYEVRAYSIKQACYLANNLMWADDVNLWSVGIVKML